MDNKNEQEQETLNKIRQESLHRQGSLVDDVRSGFQVIQADLEALYRSTYGDGTTNLHTVFLERIMHDLNGLKIDVVMHFSDALHAYDTRNDGQND